MNNRLAEALEYCHQAGIRSAVFAVPFPVSARDALAIKDAAVCRGLVLYHPPAELTETSTSEWLGCFHVPGDWQLPSAKGALVFIGSQLMLTQRMAIRTLCSGRLSVVCRMRGEFQVLQLHRFLLWKIGERLRSAVNTLPFDHPVRTGMYRMARLPFVRRIWARTFERGDISRIKRGANAPTGEALYLELFRRVYEQPPGWQIDPVPRRVILVNAGLAAGGAERQIVNTLGGLNSSGQCESVALLAEYLDHAPKIDFFLHELQGRGIEVAQVRHACSLLEDGMSSLPAALGEIVGDLPAGIVEEVLNLVEEFRSRRPSIVHAWQDSTSIKAGIAAVIAGVPRIVLASRNVTPMNFTYYQDYMYPAYRALASLGSVTFLNNSEAGAADYTNWLGLPRERFEVVRNGVDLNQLIRVGEDVVREYKQSLGIPLGVPVVGSVFRFWAEKRPMLWLKSARLVGRRFPNAHFLIIGEGPMRAEMEAFIKANGLAGRVHLPGARPDVAEALTSMDIFLLTSEFEGTPNVVLEAQWLGIPVVATDAGGTRESFEIGASGFLTVTASESEIAALVATWMEDKALVDKARLHGPEYVRRVFGIGRMIEETCGLYGLEEAG